MPQELPGFYFDSDKNRYFPIRGPIPGSSRPSPRPHSASTKSPLPTNDQSYHSGRKISSRYDLLLNREFCGNTLSINRQKKSFRQEFEKLILSHPTIWRYKGTEGKSDTAVEELCIDVETLNGERKASALLVGSMSGSLSLFETGDAMSDFDVGVMCSPDCVLPSTSEGKSGRHYAAGAIYNRNGALVPSNISCIKILKRRLYGGADDSLDNQVALVTTLGSGTCGGSVCLLNLEAPVDFSQSNPILQRRMCGIISLAYTIWTADCQPNGPLASVGTNLGAALINLETGALTWVCRSKSDMLSQQFDPLGNVLLCGFRNGNIAAIDIRQKPNAQTRIVAHRSAIPHPRKKKRLFSDTNFKTSAQKFLKLRDDMACSGVVNAASAVCSLVTLQTYDQYFLASCMDGSIKLYDQRMCSRNAVQSYDGHVNTHSHIRLAVDPSESSLMSGGEDGHVRLWSIKSGEILFDAKVSDYALSNICWSRVEEFGHLVRSGDDDIMNYSASSHHSWSAWIGSQKGLFYVHG